MANEPFAYGIQAPIGSVTPLFHKQKDAEDYIAKLTDSRDEAKIIPLYRSPTLTDAEREAVDRASETLRYLQADYGQTQTEQDAATLRGLLARTGGNHG